MAGNSRGTQERWDHRERYVRPWGWRLYTDEDSSDVLIENNVVYWTEDGGFYQNYGANDIVRNGIFAYGEKARMGRSHKGPHLSFAFEHDIFYWNLGQLLDGTWAGDEYDFDHNLYYRTDDQPT